MSSLLNPSSSRGRAAHLLHWLAVWLGVGLAPQLSAHASMPSGGAATDVRLALVREHLRDERLGEAEHELRELLEQRPLSEPAEREARLLLGQLLLDTERADEAVEVLSALEPGEDAEWRLTLGRALAARGRRAVLRQREADAAADFELARAHLEAAARGAGDGDRRALLEAAQLALYDQGEAAVARDLLDTALQDDQVAGGDGELLLLRGCAGGYLYWYARMEGAEEDATRLRLAAEADLDAARAALDPGRPEPWVQLSWLRLQEPELLPRSLEAALEAAERGTHGPLFNVATVAATRGAWGPGGQALEQLLTRDRAGLTRWLAERADADSLGEQLSMVSIQAHAATGQLDLARRIHAALAGAARGSAAVWNNYALLCRDTAQYRESLRAYRRALALSGPDPRLLNDTAIVLHDHLAEELDGALDEARELYEQAIALGERRRQTLTDEADLAQLDAALVDARANLARLLAGERTRADG